eukprot:UN01603
MFYILLVLYFFLKRNTNVDDTILLLLLLLLLLNFLPLYCLFIYSPLLPPFIDDGYVINHIYNLFFSQSVYICFFF